jgi:transcriptional regulator of heat shock response
MNLRQAKLLAAIIDEFTRTALPVGSKQILDQGIFSVSGATIRNEMQILGSEGLIEQPHTSAGRVPTVKGYRMYVQEFMNPSLHEAMVRSKFDTLRHHYFQHKDRERVYEAVSLLSSMVSNVVFATVPYRDRVYYLGLSNTIRQPEFQDDPELLSGVVEVLEHRLSELMSHIELSDVVQYYIGDSDLCPQFQSCSMLVTKYTVRDQVGAIGILGPTRMDYAYNTAALDMVASLVRDSFSSL